MGYMQLTADSSLFEVSGALAAKENWEINRSL
jgi:hypothetical protein